MKSSLFIASSFVLGIAHLAAAATTVDSLPTGVPVAGTWHNTSTNSGTASLVDLTGAGGNLENGQTLPAGALKLTTTSNTSDRGQITYYQNIGNASLMSSLNMSFDFYKASGTGANVATAPAIKIGLSNPAGTGTGADDSYGELIFEPYWNTATPYAQDQWHTISSAPGTGAGDSSTGGWWWSGGFGAASGAGGAPLRSLEEWIGVFQSGTDAADFAGASIVSITVGVGSNNPNIEGYFDNLNLNFGPGNYSESFDFQAVPEPATLTVLGLAGAALMRRRRV